MTPGRNRVMWSLHNSSTKTEGMKMSFSIGDVVRVGKGKVLYTVWANQLTRKIYLESHNTHRVTTADMDRVVLVTPAPEASDRSKTIAEAFDKHEENRAYLDTHPNTVMEEFVVEVPAKVEAEPVPEHIPGESPAQYQARTGLKLDGRTTSYGRAILAALQLKPVFSGRSRSRNDQTPGPTRRARRAFKKGQRAARKAEKG